MKTVAIANSSPALCASCISPPCEPGRRRPSAPGEKSPATRATSPSLNAGSARPVRQNRSRLLRESQLPLEKSWEAFDRQSFPAGRATAGPAGRIVSRPAGERAGVRQPGQWEDPSALRDRSGTGPGTAAVLFVPCSLLVQDLLIAKRDLRLARVLKRLSYEVIVIDDLGYVQQNREEMEVLFTLLAERDERGSVLITSNLPFSKWERSSRIP